MEDKLHSCCFIGHRETEGTDELKERVYKVVEDLIVEKGVYIFYFGNGNSSKERREKKE